MCQESHVKKMGGSYTLGGYGDIEYLYAKL